MKKFRKYFITMTAGLVAVFGISWATDIFAQTQPEAVYHILCDVFFAVGTVLCCIGLLIFSANEGTFEMLAYGMSSFLDLFRAESKKKYATFYDYRESRADRKVPFGFFLVCGVIFLAVSMVFYPLCT